VNYVKKKILVRLSVFQCNKIWYPLSSLFAAKFLNVSQTYEQPRILYVLIFRLLQQDA
jgi:hypothetical protein